MRKEIKVIYRKLKNNFERKGYININHIQIENKEKLAELGQIFRDPRYETFRMIYMKEDVIVGQEAISSRIPGFSRIFTRDRDGVIKTERNIYKMKDRMKRLDADGYYMVHNHPSGRAKASKQDIEVTKFFHTTLKGFKGHLIINSNTYAWIDIKNHKLDVSNENEITGKGNKMQKKAEKNGIYNIKIKSREDIIHLMNNIKNSKEYSVAIIVDMGNIPRMILDVPNKFLNMREEQLRGYFQNISRANGGSSIFIATDDTDTFKRSTELISKGILKDSVFYQEIGGRLYMFEKPSFEKYNPLGNTLFDNIEQEKLVRVWEDEEEYNSKKIKEKFLKVLYKEVGELPKVIKIKNTLKAKQDLVDGLIEVIPYEDALIICNEEGKLLNLDANLVFDYDYIAGNCFVVGDDYINGDFKSLTDEQVKEVFAICQNRQFINFFDIDEKEFE